MKKHSNYNSFRKSLSILGILFVLFLSSQILVIGSANAEFVPTSVVTLNESILEQNGGGFAYRESMDLSDDGRTLVVGYTGYDYDSTENVGSVYIYEYELGQWVQKKHLMPSDKTQLLGFGDTVAISGSGNTLLVRSNTDGGEVYIYRRQLDESWMLQETLVDPANGNSFGEALDVSEDGDAIVISDYVHEEVFTYHFNGGVWEQTGHLENSSTWYYGIDIAMSENGNRIFVRNDIYWDSVVDKPLNVYVYDFNGTEWHLNKKILLDKQVEDGHVTFGSLDITPGGNRFVVSDTGLDRIFVYNYSNGVWNEEPKPQMPTDANLYYPTCISADGKMIGITDHQEKVFYTKDNGLWKHKRTINASIFNTVFSTSYTHMVMSDFTDSSAKKVIAINDGHSDYSGVTQGGAVFMLSDSNDYDTYSLSNLTQLYVNESTAPPDKWVDFFNHTHPGKGILVIDEFSDESYTDWSFGNAINIYENYSVLNFYSNSNDPYMQRSIPIKLNLSEYEILRIKMKIEGGGSGTSTLYWDNGNGFPSETYAKSFTSQLDGEWHNYLFNMESVSSWSGMIDRLRFDPVAYDQRNISIDTISLIDSDSQKYRVTEQSNPSLISCKVVRDRYFNCSKPTQGLYGYSDVTVTFGDGENNFTHEIRVNVLDIDHPPTKPNLTHPANGSEISAPNVWLNYSSYDEETGYVEYFVYGGTDKGNLQLLYNGLNSSFLWSGLQKGNTYYWQVIATDGNKNSTSDIYTFDKLNSPPVFNYTFPANNSNFTVTDIMLNVSAYDPDGDSISGFYIYTGETPGALTEHQSMTGEYQWSGLTAGNTYYWQAKAFDDTYAESTTPVFQFDILFPPEGPTVTLFNQSPKIVPPPGQFEIACTGTDDEDSADQFTPVIQYKLPNSTVWEDCQHFGTLCNYENWDPANGWWDAIVDAGTGEELIGNWSFRCYLNDTLGLSSGFTYDNKTVFVGFPNTEPEITSVYVEPYSPKTKDNLTCEWGFYDKESEFLNFTVTWQNNSVMFKSENITNCANATVCSSSPLLHNFTDAGETWTCNVSVTDEDYVVTGTGAVVIEQTAPVLENHPAVYKDGMSAGSNQPYTDDVVECVSGGYYDADQDLQDAVEWRWYVNGQILPGETSKVLNLSVAGNGDQDDLIRCSQRVSDGMQWSDWYNSSEVEINGSMPLIDWSVHQVQGGDVLMGNNSVEFFANATDPDDQQYTMHVCLNNYIESSGCQPDKSLCSSNLVQSGQTAACVGNLSNVNLTDENPKNITYYIYVCDTDGKCSNAPATSSFLYAFSSIVSYNLSAGWNMISFPGYPLLSNGSKDILHADDVLDLFGADVIAGFNASRQKYYTYIPGLGKNNFSISHAGSYYVHLNSSSNALLELKQVNAYSIEIKPGWNFVNYPGKTTGFLNQQSSYIKETNVYKQGLVRRYLENLGSNNVSIEPGLGVMVHSGGEWMMEYE